MRNGRRFMRAALKEGRRALPDRLPNPPVGCVLVKADQLIASGYTQLPGQHHRRGHDEQSSRIYGLWRVARRCDIE